MGWIERETIAATLREAFTPPPTNDEFARLLAMIDKKTEAEREPIEE